MLCNTCGTECSFTMQGCESNIDLLLYHCSVCDLYQIIVKYPDNPHSSLRILRTLWYLEDSLGKEGWKVGSSRDLSTTGDRLCP